MHSDQKTTFLDAPALPLHLPTVPTEQHLDLQGQTPLHLAVFDGHVEVSELLVRSGASLDVQEQTWGLGATEGQESLRGFLGHCCEGGSALVLGKLVELKVFLEWFVTWGPIANANLRIMKGHACFSLRDCKMLHRDWWAIGARLRKRIFKYYILYGVL